MKCPKCDYELDTLQQKKMLLEKLAVIQTDLSEACRDARNLDCYSEVAGEAVYSISQWRLAVSATVLDGRKANCGSEDVLPTGS